MEMYYSFIPGQGEKQLGYYRNKRRAIKYNRGLEVYSESEKKIEDKSIQKVLKIVNKGEDFSFSRFEKHKDKVSFGTGHKVNTLSSY